MPEQRELTYEGGGLKVRIVVGAATVLAGMKRALLQGRAQAYSEQADADGVDGTARVLLARFLYPDLLASLVEAEGLDAGMEVAAFMDLPEPFTDAWQNLVYELNPHWYPFERNTAEAEKNAEPPRSDSGSDS